MMATINATGTTAAQASPGMFETVLRAPVNIKCKHKPSYNNTQSDKNALNLKKNNNDGTCGRD